MPFNPDLTFHAVVVNLIATNDGRIPLTHGALAHAAFLDLVRAADPDLASRLHNRNARQPFTLSPLRNLPDPRPNGTGYRLRAGERASLRLTVLNPDLFAAFLQRLLVVGPDLRLSLGDVTFAVESALGTPGSHPWAGYTTADELRSRAGTAPCIHMIFASPTAVSLGARGPATQRLELIPCPQHVFAALRSAWNQLTGDALPPEFEQWVADYVFIREVRSWRTAIYQLKRGAYPGGYGDVTFEALDKSSSYVRLLNLLADFAFYSGVGTKTTMGMGQVRRV